MADFDMAILGAGPGGYVAAIRAAQLGAKVALIEKEELGGVCLNAGCIPTKAIIRSAEVFRTMKDAQNYGLSAENPQVDIRKVMGRKNQIVTRLRGGIAALLKARKVEVIKGEGRLASPSSVEVAGASGKQEVKAKSIVIATGSSPLELPFFRYDGKDVLSSTDVLNLEELPGSCLIVGGGVIGCEFASILSAFGCKTTIVELLPQILPNVDPEASKRLAARFKRSGIDVLTGCRIDKLESVPDGVQARMADGKTLSARKALVCTGRKPNSGGLNLEACGVQTQKGAVVVDGKLKTGVAGVYAIGDVTGGFWLAHVASYQGLIAVENALGKAAEADYRVVPACIFTDPEIAVVGFSEEEAKKKGIDAKSSRFPYTALGKAHVAGETEGFFKLTADSKTEEIIGGMIYGYAASDLIQEIALAVKARMKIREIEETIHAHPSLPEGVMEAAGAFYNRAIHSM